MISVKILFISGEVKHTQTFESTIEPTAWVYKTEFNHSLIKVEYIPQKIGHLSA